MNPLSTTAPMLRTLPVMPHNSNAYAVRDLSKKEMIRKPLEVDSPPICFVEMKSLGIDSREINKRVQFFPKLIAQAVIDTIVMA